VTERSNASLTIEIAAPVDQCQRFFTPAGEELWVDGWQPGYLYPPDGRTQAGMVFTTGSGVDFTLWTLAEYDTAAHHARYLRVTPASRTGFVEVRCTAVGAASTRLEVGYVLTALNAEGARVLEGFRGEAFAAMIDGCRRTIDTQLPMLPEARIRSPLKPRQPRCAASPQHVADQRPPKRFHPLHQPTSSQRGQAQIGTRR
jgi:hypothetical protein